MKPFSCLFLVLISFGVMAQDPIQVANKCYEEKKYDCSTENYKKAFADKKFAEKDKALILFRIGYGLGETKKHDDAIDYLKQALAVNPNYGDAYWSLAGNYYNSTKYTEAAENYKKAIEQFKNDKSTQKTLYYWLAKSYSFSEKDNEALEAIKQSLLIDSNVANYNVVAADAYFNLGKYQDAIRHYQRSIDLGDAEKKIMAIRYYWLGESYFKLQKYPEALTAYRGSFEYDPSKGNTQWAIASVYYNTSKWKESIDEYTKTLSFYKNDSAALADIYFYRGRSYSGNKDYTKALADFDIALKYDPNYKNVYWQKGSAYYRQNKWKESIPFYTKAIELFANDKMSLDDLHFFRGNAYLQIKDTAKAKEDFLKSLSYNASLTDPQIGLGNISFGNAKYYEAKDYYTKGLNGYKTDSTEMAQLYFRKGFANAMTYNGYQAKDDMERSLKFDSTFRESHRYLGELYYNGKLYSAALKSFTKSIALYKDVKDSLPKLYSYRGMVYSQEKKYKEALADYEQAAKLKPSATEYMVGIGQLAFELKEYDKVIANFTKAIAQYKPAQKNELAFAYYARGRSYYEKKDNIKAKKDVEKAIEYVPTYEEAKKLLKQITGG